MNQKFYENSGKNAHLTVIQNLKRISKRPVSIIIYELKAGSLRKNLKFKIVNIRDFKRDSNFAFPNVHKNGRNTPLFEHLRINECSVSSFKDLESKNINYLAKLFGLKSL